MREGELKKRLLPYMDKLEGEFGCGESGEGFHEELDKLLSEIVNDYPTVSQKYVPMKGKRVHWKKLCFAMEQKIIAFENFGKKWFGEPK
jgi:hypothetical protein